MDGSNFLKIRVMSLLVVVLDYCDEIKVLNIHMYIRHFQALPWSKFVTLEPFSLKHPRHSGFEEEEIPEKLKKYVDIQL